MARKSGKWDGELAEPIDIIRCKSNSLKPATKTDMVFDIMAKQLDKLFLLLKHYNIPNTKDQVCWMLLSLRLANEFVPGFKSRVKKHFPKIESYEAFCFYKYIQNLIDDEKLTIARAVEVLCSKTNKKTKSDLEREFRTIKKNSKVVSIFEEMFKNMQKKFPDFNYKELDVFSDLEKNAISYILQGGKK